MNLRAVEQPVPQPPQARQEARGPVDPAQLLVALSLCDDAREIAARLEAWLGQALAPCRCSLILGGTDEVAGGAAAPGSRQLLVPVRHGDRLLGAIQLDLPHAIAADQRRWLRIVAQGAAAELARVDALARAQSARRRAEQLGRYVPAPILERIGRGEQAAGGERDISVLFLDLRGYIARASLLRCSQVFRLINRYVRAASAIVRRHGGAVTEFNGDGLMAVFGAPEALPQRERAALQAALELAEQVPPVIGEPSDGDQLVLGIGVASGRGFVGDVVSEDRLIWTAVGNPINLAARLQALTRELATPVLVDEASWRGAEELGAGFERHERVSVRGFPDPVTVYALRDRAPRP